jgi:hypothetical protein
MTRAAQFIRSVIPSDPWQLVFLAGAIFLSISPRLRWPSDFDSYGAAMSSPGFSKGVAVADLVRVVNMLLNLMTFGGLAGYAMCFWPGDKPVRRVLLSVFLPTLVSLAIILCIFVQRSRPASSIFESHATFLLVFRWLLANSLNLPVGLYFSLLSLLLIAVFTFRLYSGQSSLPLALPQRPAPPTESPDSWLQLELLIFILVGPFFLLRGLADVFFWSAHSSLARIGPLFLHISCNNLGFSGGRSDSASALCLDSWSIGGKRRHAIPFGCRSRVTRSLPCCSP